MSEKIKKLLEIDVSSYTEKKNGLTYLSWANAWREVLKVAPDAQYKIVKNDQGVCAFGNGEQGYMVYTEVTIEGTTHEMWLPVMDFRNQSIKNPSTFDINKSVMRCLTKNLAMFGLGLYIYAGEDLPEDAPESAQKAPQATKKHAKDVAPTQSKKDPQSVLAEKRAAVLAAFKGLTDEADLQLVAGKPIKAWDEPEFTKLREYHKKLTEKAG